MIADFKEPKTAKIAYEKLGRELQRLEEPPRQKKRPGFPWGTTGGTVLAGVGLFFLCGWKRGEPGSTSEKD